MIFKYIFSFFLVVVLLSQELFAQNIADDTHALSATLSKTLEFYKISLGNNAHLYNGTEYVGHFKNIVGDPYFESGQMQMGSIYYDGILYPNIFLLYDLVNDEIIIKDFTSNYNVRLLPEKVAYFSVLNHLFIRVVRDNSSDLSWENGFYDRLYFDKTMVLAKRRKQVYYSTTAVEVISEFVQYDSYLIIKDDDYYPVTNKRSLLSIFQDRKNEIRRFIHENKLDLKKEKEKTIIKITTYYDQLKK